MVVHSAFRLINQSATSCVQRKVTMIASADETTKHSVLSIEIVSQVVSRQSLADRILTRWGASYETMLQSAVASAVFQWNSARASQAASNCLQASSKMLGSVRKKRPSAVRETLSLAVGVPRPARVIGWPSLTGAPRETDTLSGNVHSDV